MTGLDLIGVKARTALALGIPNLGRAFCYKIGVKLGINSVRRLKAAVPTGPFFGPAAERAVVEPSEAWRNQMRYFGWFPVALPGGHCPDWHTNPFSAERANASLPWWRIPDFDPQAGDIKAVWETSRFDWALAMAERAAAGDRSEIGRLNAWLADWCERNPPYCGPNWKCGQEASIRVMHLAMAALMLGQTGAPSRGLVELIRAHLGRIAPTAGYAMAQDNNHSISEAAGLYVGGCWLVRLGDPQGARWQNLGLNWLENRVERLVQPDGSFSQYSLNYHRVLLDTISMVEIWRRHLNLPRFSACWQHRATAATRWLATMVNPGTGDAPNLGANDGARLLPLTDTDFRDFRPTVQLAAALFVDRRAYAGDGAWNTPLAWLGVALPVTADDEPTSQLYDHGGYAVLRRTDTMAVLRYPRFKFRPGHADALHVDLWVAGQNLLRDAGSFSYAAATEWIDYFTGVTGHSTVQFDERDQMPRLSRFLFGAWLKTVSVEPLLDTTDAITCGASYRDRHGATHARRLRLNSDRLSIHDEVGGFSRKAVVRWRLRPGAWRVEGQAVTDGRDQVKIETRMPVFRFELVRGWESRYYLQKTEVPVLEVEVHEPGVLTTEYRWGA